MKNDPSTNNVRAPEHAVRGTPSIPDEIEWGRVASVQRRFPIGKTLIYDLIEAGKIRSCVIRKRNCQRGTRLIEMRSVREFLESIAPKSGSRSQAENLQPTES
jgi:hypothetical protein